MNDLAKIKLLNTKPYFPHFSFPFSLNFRGEHKPSVAGVS